MAIIDLYFGVDIQILDMHTFSIMMHVRQLHHFFFSESHVHMKQRKLNGLQTIIVDCCYIPAAAKAHLFSSKNFKRWRLCHLLCYSLNVQRRYVQLSFETQESPEIVCSSSIDPIQRLHLAAPPLHGKLRQWQAAWMWRRQKDRMSLGIFSNPSCSSIDHLLLHRRWQKFPVFSIHGSPPNQTSQGGGVGFAERKRKKWRRWSRIK